ncbi:MAG TPA: ABC transporter ATP-binding protein [Actinomycetota bacterium]
MPENVVELTSVSRSFGRVRALVDFSLAVPRGTITALLGPNGAGKTTTVRVITGGLRPDGGTVRAFGADPEIDGEMIRGRCGVVSAKPALYDRLSGWDNLLYSARLYGVEDTADIRGAAARFGIDHALDLNVGTYSTGMKTRLALARSILHDPELMLLDEPTAGLDPESARAVLELIRALAHDGKTVLLCTHLLLEAEGLADQIAIMELGRSVLQGAPGELAKRFWPHQLLVLDAEDRETLAEAKNFDGVVSFERNGHALVQMDDLARVPDLVAFLTARGVRLTRVEPRVPTLEELYFHSRGRDR